MELVSRQIVSFLKEQGLGSFVEDFTHMVFLGFYDKRDDKKNVLQLPDHRDQRFSNTGKFLTSLNSQKINTATCILVLGDARRLRMLCYRDNDRGDGKGPIPVKQQFSSKVFEMKHGSLFFLHPGDEQTKLREHFDPVRLTYFKHGNVYFGKDGLSIGLAFRVTTHYNLVDAETGLAVPSADVVPNTTESDLVLEEYLANPERRHMNEEKLRSLYLRLRHAHF